MHIFVKSPFAQCVWGELSPRHVGRNHQKETTLGNIKTQEIAS